MTLWHDLMGPHQLLLEGLEWGSERFGTIKASIFLLRASKTLFAVPSYRLPFGSS